MRPHKCHALGCNIGTKPEMFMCFMHWRMLTKSHRDAIKKYYRPGQCDDRNPSKPYIEAARAAQEHIVKATKENFIKSAKSGPQKNFLELPSEPLILHGGRP